jgi:hypothetical protein
MSKDFLAFNTDGDILSLDGKLVRKHGVVVDSSMKAAIRATLGVPGAAEGLTPANNLSDVSSAATSRTNLDVMATADVNARAYSRQPANGLEFNGSSNIHSTAHGASLDFGTATDFSVFATVYNPGTRNDDCIASSRGGGAVGWFLGYSATGRVQFILGDGTTTVTSTDDGDVIPEGWHVLGVTVDRNGNATRWLNGIPQGTADSVSAVALTINNSNGIQIGHQNSAKLWPGIISDLVIWKRLLTSAEALRWSQDRVIAASDQWANIALALLSENIDDDADWRDASGNGLTATGSATALFDNSREAGTFTPAITFGGGNTGMTTAGQGNYRMIAPKTCHVWGRITFSAKGSSTGTAVLTGMPKTSDDVALDANVFPLRGNNMASLTSMPLATITKDSSQATLYDTGASGVVVLDDTNFLDTTILIFDFVYETK